MNQGLLVVIGMTVINLFSFAGLIFAWIYYNKHKENKTEKPQGSDIPFWVISYRRLFLRYRFGSRSDCINISAKS
jgi:hypothetical protein